MKAKALVATALSIMVLGAFATANAAHLQIEARNSQAYQTWKAEQMANPDLAIQPEEVGGVTPISRFSRPKGDLTNKVKLYAAAYKRWQEKQSKEQLPYNDPDKKTIKDYTVPKDGVYPTGTSYPKNVVKSFAGDIIEMPVPPEKVVGDWHELGYAADVYIEPVTAEDVRFDGYHSDVHR